MVKEIQCPGKDLGELVKRLQPVVFESLNQTYSDLYDAETYLQDRDAGEHSGLHLQLIDELELEGTRIDFERRNQEDPSGLHHKTLEELESEERINYWKLREYGDTREVIVANLGIHVQNHRACMDSYRDFLEAEANSERYMDTVKRRLRISDTSREDFSHEEILETIDRDYLNILKQLPVVKIA